MIWVSCLKNINTNFNQEIDLNLDPNSHEALKYDAWMKLGGLSNQEAKKAYVKRAKELSHLYAEPKPGRRYSLPEAEDLYFRR